MRGARYPGYADADRASGANRWNRNAARRRSRKKFTCCCYETVGITKDEMMFPAGICLAAKTAIEFGQKRMKNEQRMREIMTSKETDAMWGGWNKEVSGPLNAGVYETNHFGDPAGCIGYQYWTGEYWCMPNTDIVEAAENRTKSTIQNVSFRPLQDPGERAVYGPSPLGWQHFEPKTGHGPAPDAAASYWESPGQEFEPEPASALDTQVGGDHYKKLGDYQPWAVLKAWLTPEEFRGYMKGTAIAYLARERDKGGDQDVAKAAHTLQGLIEMSDFREVGK